MPTISIQDPQKVPTHGAWLSLGFRPFFLGAALFSSLSILLWAILYHQFWSFSLTALSFSQWHAHEMIYGYGSAIIAGFLLTAVRNWTGIMTLQGKPLLALFLLWLSARLLFLFTAGQSLALLLNILFLISLSVVLSLPLYKTKKWQQLSVLSKVYLLAIFELLFLLGYWEQLENGIHLGLYGGLYLVLGLVLLMGNRVIPFFIERGVGEAIKINSLKYLQTLGLVLFAIFFLLDLFSPWRDLVAVLSFALFVINAQRLWAWYHPRLWKNSMIWSLYLGYACLTFGFLGLSLSHWLSLYSLLSIHLFAYGGVGLISFAMMARVALGHTGRDVNQPPKGIALAMIALVIGVIIRVGFPLMDMSHYTLWIALSQGLWIVAFLTFSISYYPILTQKRVDNL